MTTVRMPVRIRIEVAADRVGDGLVATVTDAVDAALGRAVDRALGLRVVSEAPERRAAPATVCFSGDPLPERIAGELEESLLLSVELAAARLLRRTPPSADDGAAYGAADGTGEPRDDDRVVLGVSGDAYRVPYYHQRGRTTDLRLQGLPPDPQPPVRPRNLQLWQFRELDEVPRAVAWYLGGTPDGTVAAIAAAADGLAYVVFIEFAGPTYRLQAMPLAIWTFAGGARQASLATVKGFVSADQWSFFGEAHGAAQVRDLLIEAELLDLMRNAPGVSQDDLRRQASRKVDRLPPRGSDSAYLYQLTSGGSPVWIGETDPHLPRGPIDVVVLTAEDPRQRDDTYGKCPPLDAEGPATWLSMFGLLHASPSTPDTPFLGEPGLELFAPVVSARLTRKVAEVAGLLHLTPGKYVGGFLIGAMVQIDRNCRNLARNRAPFGPQLKNMAGAFRAVKELELTYINVLLSQDELKALPCPVAGHSAQWVDEFCRVFHSARDDAVASMFVSQCQDVLMQVLFSSGHELRRRLDNFGPYMAVTGMFLRVMLADVPELMELREPLIAERIRKRAFASVAFGGAGPLAAEWLSTSGLVVDSLLPDLASHDPEAGTLGHFKDGSRVYDGKGRWWSLAELDAVIATQRQQATTVDPVLDKVAEVDEVVQKLKAAQVLDAYASTAAGRMLTDEVDATFKALLVDLINDNADWQKKAVNDRKLAFGLASFKRDDERANSGLGLTLTGIHKLADERLGPLFTDPEAYALGINQLADQEIGKAELSEILNLVGLTVLAIFCPPLAFAVGVLQAAEGLHTAFEHRDLQRAMLDADEILSKAQVEAEMWAAVINMALAVVPEVPALARGARNIGRAALEEGVTDVAVNATRQAMREVMQKLAQLSVEHFTVQFTKELGKAYLINLALSKAMNRMTDAVARQVEVTGDASIGDLGEILDTAIGGGTP